MPIGLDPNAECEFTHEGVKCRSRYLTMGAHLRLAELREKMLAATDDASAMATMAEALTVGRMLSFDGKPATGENLADTFTFREAVMLFIAWPAEVSRLEADLKKASPSPQPSEPGASVSHAGAAAA